MGAHRLCNRSAPVAFLVSCATASSGEVDGVAFHWRPNLRAVGASSAGFNTADGLYPLSDGTCMTMTFEANRHRRGLRYACWIVLCNFVPLE